MRFIRSVLVVLLVFSLAVPPAVAKVCFALKEGPSSSRETAAHKMAAMPDCHHAMQERAQHEPAQHTPSSHKPAGHKCPDCDKHGSCQTDLCQLKCFKVLGAVPDDSRAALIVSQRYDFLVLLAAEPLSWKPRIPPPRR